jgi:glycosyltransferase involved in cell wall biosynthesis
VICLGSEQARVLTEEVGLPAAKVKRLHNWLDHTFFRPTGHAREDFVVAVGMESRDYPTLQAAASGLPYRFHVIASGWSPDAGYSAAAGIGDRGNVVVERGVTTAALRELYTRARLVVVPLKSVPYAAGVTAVLEAMAMGKAVVVSASPGIMDYVIDGTSARVVPVGDADALRTAIDRLWRDQAEIDRMERHNRAWIESTLNTDQYVEAVAGLLKAPRGRPPA